MTNLGPLAWLVFWVAAISGGCLFLFPDADILHGLHRYASQALFIVVVLHALREFSLDRAQSERSFTWITGVALLSFVYISGMTGYLLTGEETPSYLVFIHLSLPLLFVALTWLHVRQLSRVRLNPPALLAVAATLLLVALAFLTSAEDSAPDTLAAVPNGMVLLVPVAMIALFALLPRLQSPSQAWKPVVSLNNCNGCARCAEDCPYGAITMQPRSDGKSYALEALVDENRCVSCGICTGSCPTSVPFRRTSAIIPGIEMADHTVADLREKTLDATNSFGEGQRVLVYACDHCGAESLENTDARTVRVPCTGMLPPAFIDFVLSRDLADGVMLAGCAEGDCYFRLGDAWTNQRIDGERDPYLRKGTDLDRIETSWLPAASRKRRLRDLHDFSAWLATLPPREPRQKRNRAGGGG